MKNSVTTFIASMVFVSVSWFILFSGATEFSLFVTTNHFWLGISCVTALMLVLMWFVYGDNLRPLLRSSKHSLGTELRTGMIHGLLLAGVSIAGLYLVTEYIPELRANVEKILALRVQLSPWLSAIVLIFLIAPAEEIFWRGYVLDFAGQRFSTRTSLVFMAAADAIVHITTGNVMLVVAAGTLGLVWGLLRRSTGTVLPCIISHAVWDICVFLVYPLL